MSALDKLVEGNTQGKLGLALVAEFGGERGHVYPRQDDEFAVGFESEGAIPSVSQVKDFVVDFYTREGASVVRATTGIPDNMVEAVVFDGERPVIALVISIKMTLTPGEERKYLRVTTNIL